MARYVPLTGSPLDSIQDGRIGRINAGFRQPQPCMTDTEQMTANERRLMRLLLRHLDGSLQAAILRATFGGNLRVSIPACDDAVGFRWVDGQWLAENGDAVEIHFDADRKSTRLNSSH